MIEEEVLHHHGISYIIDIPEPFNTPLYLAYYYIDYYLIAILLTIACLIILWKCVIIEKNEGYQFGDIYRAWFKGKKTTASRMVAYWVSHSIFFISPTIILDYPMFKAHPILGMIICPLIAASIYCLCYCEYYSFIPNLSVWNLLRTDLNGPWFEEGSKKAPETMPSHQETDNGTEPTNDTESTKDESDKPTIPEAELVLTNNSLIERMKSALADKKVYTDANITIELLAKQLGTNRTTLSALVNHTYGMSFKSLIATLRIEEAKHRILQDPTLTFDIISFECGFKDKGNFFHRFKELTGETPRSWMQNHIKG